MADPADLKTITVNGAMFHYIEQGAGQAVVFVHGALESYDTWLGQIEPFSHQFRAVSYSRRYHFPNPWTGDGTDYTVSRHADDLIALIETLGLAPAHGVGLSFGAQVVMLAAIRCPDLFGKIVLDEPLLLSWLKEIPGGQEDIDNFITNTRFAARDAFRKGEMEEGVRIFVDGVLGKGGFDRLPAAIQAAAMRNARELQAETSMPEEVYHTKISVQEVEGLRVPTLLVSSEISPRMFHRVSDRLAQALPVAQRAVIPGVSHNAHNANPAEFNRAVLSFLIRE